MTQGAPAPPEPMPDGGRAHRQLLPGNRDIRIPPYYQVPFGDISVKFPFQEPFQAQKVTMAAALRAMKEQKNALLESPTGTGKTIALLASCLAYMDGFPQVDRVYYASRTHAQLKQVVNELKKLPYFPKMSILASRKKLCIYQPVKGCSNPDAKCKELEVRHQGCPYDRVVGDVRYFSIDGQCPKFDLDDLIEYGGKHQLCPYYMAKRMAASAELVISPYNYLLSPGKNQIVTERTVVVFDEGHNMDSVCRQEESLIMRYSDIFNAGNDAAKAPPQSRYQHLFAFMKRLTEVWLRFIHEARENMPESDRRETQYWSKYSYRELIERTGYRLEGYQTHGRQLMEWSAKIESDPAAYNDYMTNVLLAFAENVGPKIFFVEQSTVDDFRVAFTPGHSEYTDTISILCMRPGILFKKVARAARSVMIASGTLSPFDALSAELEAPFEVVECAPHVVDNSQILTLSINRHHGVEITSNYKHMSEKGPKTYQAVSDVVEKLIATVPGSVLLFLTSYAAKANLLDSMDETGALLRINRVKQIVEEEPEKEAKHVLWLMEKANWNALMVGVHRGKISEGIDFNDDKARMVILFGVPFSSFKSADVELKMKYNDEMCKKRPGYLSGGKWYELQAFRALNQSLGRLIRHKNDYGVIVLLDWRINNRLDYLPKWLRGNMRQNISVDDAVKLLCSFYTEMHRRFPMYLPPPQPSKVPYDVRPAALPPPPSPTLSAPVKPPEPPAKTDFVSASSMQQRPVVDLTMDDSPKIREVNHNGTVLYCTQCNRPILTLKSLDNVSFEKVEAKGVLKATKNSFVGSALMMRFLPEEEIGLYCDASPPQWFPEEDCSYKKITCDCGCIVGIQVSAVPAHHKYQWGLYLILVRCLCLEYHGKYVSLLDLAAQVDS